MNNNRTSLLSAGWSRHTAPGNPLAVTDPEIDTKKLFLPQQAIGRGWHERQGPPVELKAGKKNEKWINGRCDKAAHARTNKGNSWEEKHVRQKKKMQSWILRIWPETTPVWINTIIRLATVCSYNNFWMFLLKVCWVSTSSLHVSTLTWQTLPCATFNYSVSLSLSLSLSQTREVEVVGEKLWRNQDWSRCTSNLAISAAKLLLIKLTLACVIHGVQATRLLANICDVSWLDKRDSLHGVREKCRARSSRFFHSHTQSGTRVMGGGGGGGAVDLEHTELELDKHIPWRTAQTSSVHSAGKNDHPAQRRRR